MASNSQHRCVFVGNIPYDATEEQLVQICEEVGPVVSFRLVLDRETGKPKGYGFCEYKDEETALSARRNLQGYEINGRQLRVDFAENDKNADRNREQVKGRGGPGLMSNTDVQKASDAGVIPISHPLGFQVAETAASVMAGHLGGGQSSLPSLYGQSGLRNDPLTQYLATMSRNQLLEVTAEMKALVTQNKALAQQLLQSNSQFLKALFQAQLMLGMVTPQMMSHIRRSSDLGVQHQGFDAGQTPMLLPHNGPAPMLLNAPMIGSVGAVSRAQEVTSNLINTPLITHPTGLTHHIPVQSQYSIPQVPPPLFQLQDTSASTSTGQAEKSAPGTSIGAQTLYPPVVSAQVPISVQPPLLLQPGHVSEKIPSQRPFSATGSQQQVQPQHPTSQFSAEVETALLQQVMSLTPEQLTSLPAEQRQQVILLQQMLQS